MELLKITIAHIISPVHAIEGSELHRVQPITFESMRRAKKQAADIAEVSLITAQLPADHAAVPADFHSTPDLSRSLKDALPVTNRKLPLLGDILQRACDNTEAEYIVYTNADIAVMPVFYRMVVHYINEGYDAFSINRRRITSRFSTIAQLDQMYAEIGECHTGFDTFVFKRSLYPKFFMGTVAVGLPFVDRALIHNLYAHASNFRLFTRKHLTFHIGMELVKDWGNSEEVRHNEKQSIEVLRKLKPDFKISAFPGANRNFFVRHWKWLMNPTFHYPTMLKLDLSQLNQPRRPRTKQPKQEVSQSWVEWLVKRINFDDEY